MKKTLFAAYILCTAFTMNAQETTVTSGGQATGSGGSSSYTVGQLVYTTNSGSSGTISQGVQQSFELFTLSNPEVTSVNLTAVTFPNPTSDYITLNITDSALNDLHYNLIDVSGKVISNGLIKDTDTKIGMQNLSMGVYILIVIQNNQALKTFKIIKN